MSTKDATLAPVTFREVDLTQHIERPRNLTTNRSSTFRHIHDDERKRDYATYAKQRAISKKRDRVSGLHNVQYTIASRELRTFHNDTTALCIHIELQCDQSWTPFCASH